MKYLLILSFLCTQVCLAQKKTTYNYIVKFNNSAGTSIEEKTYYITLQEIKSLSGQNRLMELRVDGFDFEDKSVTGRTFSTGAPDKSKDFLNSTSALSDLYYLKKPLQFTVSKGLVNVDTSAWKDEIKQQLHDWEIREDVFENAVVTTFSGMSNLAQSLYFYGLALMDSKALKENEITKDGVTYHILQRDKVGIHVNYSKLDSLSTLEGNTRFDVKNYLVQVGDRNLKNTYVMDDGQKITSRSKISIQRGDKYQSNPIENDYYDMLVKGSYWSTALSLGDKVDSLKLEQYITVYEPKYANDRSFISNKLRHLQKLDDYKQYDKALSSVPPGMLAGTHHLSNKVNTDDLSVDEFREIIPLLDDRQLYDYLQYSLSQHILAKDTLASQRLQIIASQFSEREKTAAQPMYLWARALQTEDIESLKLLQQEIFNTDEAYWNQGNAGRYALLLQQLLFKKGEHGLQTLQHIIDKIVPLYEDETNELRFIQKAHLAYAYYLAYERAIDHEEQALSFLEKAAYYSPKNGAEKAYGSFYDRVFLKSKENYSDDYFAALSKRGKKDVALQSYVQEFLNNPGSSFQSLSAFYRENYDEANFSTFFKNEVISQLPDAPLFSLKDLQDKDFTSEQFRGKWTVVDFWGTWCGPCVEEMPKLNKYYLGLKKDQKNKIDFMTIACHDTKEKVQHFLSDNNYEIPVLMSDNKIQGAYKVRGYPSKYIITPEGKLISTEFGFDWQTLISQLANL
ncbi:TlpA family protein disulfide reductase [Sphingobacterium olei]|uniref:TlpA family protein disulfide reductase n=1 Tax=Sphingobacterium olei TaxID=2571155 RepID=A0A4U0PJ50_9SPHI|nr:TlpA disulfide reductase family protein [Sphingobacterium olei]TJZ62924.1 TlpA family protein disulfide reductase [Sphingobacterium olei]